MKNMYYEMYKGDFEKSGLSHQHIENTQLSFSEETVRLTEEGKNMLTGKITVIEKKGKDTAIVKMKKGSEL